MEQTGVFSWARNRIGMQAIIVTSLLIAPSISLANETVNEVVVTGYPTDPWGRESWRDRLREENIRAQNDRRAAETAMRQAQDRYIREAQEESAQARAAAEEERERQLIQCKAKVEGEHSGCQYVAASTMKGDKDVDCDSLLVDSGSVSLQIGLYNTVTFSAGVSSTSRYDRCIDRAETAFEVEKARCSMVRDVAIESCIRNHGP